MWPLRPRRNLFRFWDGSRHRRADPLAILRGLYEDEEFRIEVHPQLVEQGDSESTDVMLRAIRRVFGVKEFADGQAGMTQIETLDLFRIYSLYMDALKKNINISPTLPASSEPMLDASSAQTMSDTSASSSIEEEQKSAAPTESELASAPM